MIVERRCYLLTPRADREFWAVQRDWYWPPEIGDFFHHLIGYFETTGKGPKSIVHLYRFASLADWEARYHALYRRFPPEYFTVVRTLLSAQDNSFMRPAPLDVPGIADLGSPLAAALDYPVYGEEPPPGLVLQECITDFHPGGASVYWDALANSPRPALCHNLVGLFQSTTGQLHRAFEYRWFASPGEGDADRTRWDTAPGLADAVRAAEPYRIKRTVRYLKPAPFPWLRPLFEKLNWAEFEARDPTLRRIAAWPPPVA